MPSTSGSLKGGLDTLSQSVVVGGTRHIVYGWVIVGAAFLCNFVVDGVAGTFGQYLNEFKKQTEELGWQTWHISWIGSMLYGVYLGMEMYCSFGLFYILSPSMAVKFCTSVGSACVGSFVGPIACALADTFGYRLIIAIGAIIATTGFAASYAVSNFYVLIFTYGVIGGIGFGLIYSPSIMYVCAYFKEQQAFPVGITVCGSSVGGMVFPLIIPKIIAAWGWQGSMLFLAASALLCCFAAALMYDPQHKGKSIEPQKGCLPPLVRDAFRDMAKLGIYRNPNFLLYSLASFIGSLALLTPIFFLPQLFEDRFGVNAETSAYALTALNCANIGGRIFWGLIVDKVGVEALRVHNVAVMIAGALLAMIPVCTTFPGMLAVGAFYGFFIAPYISLMAVILSSRLGPEQLPVAFGQTQLLAGIASLIGPPIAEVIKGNAAFYSSGAMWIAAALIASGLFFLKKDTARPASPAEKEGLNHHNHLSLDV